MNLKGSLTTRVSSTFELDKQKLLIISPHPDDKILGCGGLIKKLNIAEGKYTFFF